MKNVFALALGLLTSATLFAQDAQDQEEPTTGYKRTAIYSASGSFTDLSNWNAGGENTANIALLLRENWVKKDANWTTVHLLEGNYGLSRQAGVFTKNADKLEFTTTVTGSPKKSDWNISGQVNARTQFAPGFAAGDTTMTPISTIGAPIYGQFSIGMGNSANDNWQIFISPLAGKSTTVLDQTLRDKGAFGVDTGSTWRLEAGAKLTLNYMEQVTDQFSVTAKADVFYNYATSVAATDVALDFIAIYKLHEYLSLSAQLQLNRDIDQIDAWQRRSVLGVGLAYTIK